MCRTLIISYSFLQIQPTVSIIYKKYFVTIDKNAPDKDYVASLLVMPSEEIYHKTYETHFKNEFKCYIEVSDTIKGDNAVCKALFNKKNTLNFIYNYWIRSEMVFLRNMIKSSFSVLFLTKI